MAQTGFQDTIGTDDTVFVKPNYTYPEPRPGVTTSAEVLEATLGLLKDHADRVIVGEGDGGYASFTAEESLEGHDLASICQRAGAEPVNLSKGDQVTVEEEVLGKQVSVQLRQDVVDQIDVGVSLPVMKTHVIHHVSLTLKNLWGCDGDTMRLLRRKYLPRRIALLADRFNMQLGVVDATTALDGQGPIDGDPVEVGLVAAGNDLTATDAAIARIMGYDPARLNMIATNARAQHTDIDESAINVDYEGAIPVHPFEIDRRFVDYLSILTFKSSLLAKTVYDSPFTPLIYGLFGKTPKKRLYEE